MNRPHHALPLGRPIRKWPFSRAIRRATQEHIALHAGRNIATKGQIKIKITLGWQRMPPEVKQWFESD